MISWIKHILALRDAILLRDSPRQMAIGLALGMLVGLLPKGNLLAITLAVAILSTRASLATAALAVLFFSMLGPLCDPVTHRLGHFVLTHPSMLPFWTSVYQAPLAPWTAMNNTVVMGNLLVGLALIYPTYRVSWLLLVSYGERRAARSMDAARGRECTGELDMTS